MCIHIYRREVVILYYNLHFETCVSRVRPSPKGVPHAGILRLAATRRSKKKTCVQEIQKLRLQERQKGMGDWT